MTRSASCPGSMITHSSPAAGATTKQLAANEPAGNPATSTQTGYLTGPAALRTGNNSTDLRSRRVRFANDQAYAVQAGEPRGSGTREVRTHAGQQGTRSQARPRTLRAAAAGTTGAAAEDPAAVHYRDHRCHGPGPGPGAVPRVHRQHAKSETRRQGVRVRDAHADAHRDHGGRARAPLHVYRLQRREAEPALRDAELECQLHGDDPDQPRPDRHQPG